MTLIVPKEQDEELEFRPVPGTSLRVATGGKGPPTDEMTVSWLNDLELGSLFLSRDSLNQRNFILKLAILVNRNHDKSASLVSFQNLDGPNNTLWVDTKEYCRQYKYLDVLEIINLDELPNVDTPTVDKNDGSEERPKE